MSSLAPEQIFASQKAGFDTLYSLAAKSFEGFEKLVELNVQTVKSSLAENQDLVGKALPSAIRKNSSRCRRAGRRRTPSACKRIGATCTPC